MAARENQGLQIALIIFVMLTIVLAVTTYVFFSSSQEYQKKAEAADKARAESETAMRTAIEESTDFRKLLGADAKAKREDIAKKFAEDAKVAPDLKEADQSYPKLVEFLKAEISKKDGDLAAKELANQALKAELDKGTAEKVASDGEYTKDKTEQVAEVTQAKAAADAAQNDYKAKTASIQTAFDGQRKQLEAAAGKLRNELSSREGTIKNQAGVIEGFKTERDQADISTATPDGKVTFVNQRAQLVWINLGSEDGLRKQTTFSVKAAGTNNAITAEKKADIEVTRILGPHLAEGRFLNDNLSDPILPGDVIFSPLFEAGKAEHFALAGFMDFDEDGRSDRERVKQLIELNGGVVDAEVTDDGKKVGGITVKTRYLVLGEQPSDQGGTAEFRNSYSRMLSEAEQLGVKKMPFKELLDHIGFDPRKDRTVLLGSDARREDFAPEFKGGVQRKSTGNVSEFKPRSPVQRGKTKSAY
jgi:hypothetical protein